MKDREAPRKRKVQRLPRQDRQELLTALRWAEAQGFEGLARFYGELRQEHRQTGRA